MSSQLVIVALIAEPQAAEWVKCRVVLGLPDWLCRWVGLSDADTAALRKAGERFRQQAGESGDVAGEQEAARRGSLARAIGPRDGIARAVYQRFAANHESATGFADVCARLADYCEEVADQLDHDSYSYVLGWLVQLRDVIQSGGRLSFPQLVLRAVLIEALSGIAIDAVAWAAVGERGQVRSALAAGVGGLGGGLSGAVVGFVLSRRLAGQLMGGPLAEFGARGFIGFMADVAGQLTGTAASALVTGENPLAGLTWQGVTASGAVGGIGEVLFGLADRRFSPGVHVPGGADTEVNASPMTPGSGKPAAFDDGLLVRGAEPAHAAASKRADTGAVDSGPSTGGIPQHVAEPHGPGVSSAKVPGEHVAHQANRTAEELTSSPARGAHASGELSGAVGQASGAERSDGIGRPHVDSDSTRDSAGDELSGAHGNPAPEPKIPREPRVPADMDVFGHGMPRNESLHGPEGRGFPHLDAMPLPAGSHPVGAGVSDAHVWKRLAELVPPRLVPEDAAIFEHQRNVVKAGGVIPPIKGRSLVKANQLDEETFRSYSISDYYDIAQSVKKFYIQHVDKMWQDLNTSRSDYPLFREAERLLSENEMREHFIRIVDNTPAARDYTKYVPRFRKAIVKDITERVSWRLDSTMGAAFRRRVDEMPGSQGAKFLSRMIDRAIPLRDIYDPEAKRQSPRHFSDIGEVKTAAQRDRNAVQGLASLWSESDVAKKFRVHQRHVSWLMTCLKNEIADTPVSRLDQKVDEWSARYNLNRTTALRLYDRLNFSKKEYQALLLRALTRQTCSNVELAKCFGKAPSAIAMFKTRLRGALEEVADSGVDLEWILKHAEKRRGDPSVFRDLWRVYREKADQLGVQPEEIRDFHVSLYEATPYRRRIAQALDGRWNAREQNVAEESKTERMVVYKVKDDLRSIVAENSARTAKDKIRIRYKLTAEQAQSLWENVRHEKRT